MKKFIKDVKNNNSSIMKITNVGLKISFIVGLFFTYILFLYISNPFSHVAFDIGILGVKCCSMFFVAFFAPSIFVNQVRKI